MIITLKNIVTVALLCCVSCTFMACQSGDSKTLGNGHEKGTGIGGTMSIGSTVASIEHTPGLLRKIDDIPQEMLDFEETRKMLLDEHGKKVWDYRKFEDPNDHLRVLIAAISGAETRDFAGYSGYINTLAENTCSNRYCIHDFNDRLLPFVQKALVRVLDEKDSFDGPGWMIRDSAKPLIRTLGARPHISSGDALMKTMMEGKDGECRTSLQGYRTIDCAWNAQDLAFDAFEKCTNNLIGKNRLPPCKNRSIFRGLFPALKLECLIAWARVRPQLEQRGLIGKEPSWGVLQRGALLYQKEKGQKKSLIEMTEAERLEYLERTKKKEEEWCNR